MLRATGFCWIVLLAGLAGCSRTETVAHGRIALTEAPQRIEFSRVVAAYGPARELCFEFARPGDSRLAENIRAVLIEADGRRDTLYVSEVDRRGESSVCLVDKITDRVNDTPPMRYRAVELRSEVPVEIRSVRWHGGKPRSSR